MYADSAEKDSTQTRLFHAAAGLSKINSTGHIYVHIYILKLLNLLPYIMLFDFHLLIAETWSVNYLCLEGKAAAAIVQTCHTVKKVSTQHDGTDFPRGRIAS